MWSDGMRRSRSILPAILGLLFAAVFGATPVRAQTATRPIRIRDVTVVDGPGGVRTHMDVTLRDGRIASVLPATEDTTFEGSVIDGRGQWLVPGLVDAHVHIGDNPTDQARRILRWGLEGGVTTVRDMAGDARRLAGLKVSLLAGEISGPSIYYVALMAGPAFLADPRLVAATRGYAKGESPYMIPLTHATDIPVAIAKAKGTGATAIKLYAALDAELVRAATREAHRQGLRVWAHSAIFPARPVEILDAGVDAVSHAPYVIWEAAPPTEDFTLRAKGDFEHVPADGPAMKQVVDAMVRNRTVLDPTLFVFDRNQDEPVARNRLAWGAEFTRRAHAAGVTIAAGTDGFGEPLAGELPNVHTEMELLVRLAGFTPLEALTAGTMGGAMAIGIEDRIGSIEPGRDADLVLLSGDPTADIRNTRRIAAVFQAGRRIR
jgi:imidazolonepropionase-like amidohydrolase